VIFKHVDRCLYNATTLSWAQYQKHMAVLLHESEEQY